MKSQYFNTQVALLGSPPYALLYLKGDKWIAIDLYTIRPEPKFKGMKEARISRHKLKIDDEIFEIL